MIKAETNLTPREVHVIFEVLKGKSTNDIARSLFISSHTVKAHLKNVFSKSHTKKKVELILKIFSKLTSNSLTQDELLSAILKLTE